MEETEITPVKEVEPNPEPVKETVFSKEQLIGSQKYGGVKDLLTALLQDGESYSYLEVDKRIKKFMKGKVE